MNACSGSSDREGGDGRPKEWGTKFLSSSSPRAAHMLVMPRLNHLWVFEEVGNGGICSDLEEEEKRPDFFIMGRVREVASDGRRKIIVGQKSMYHTLCFG